MALAVSSFIAGMFTFFAPCTLPLVPAFLGVISGVSPEELRNKEKAKRVKWKVFGNAIFYVLGFSFIFILFGIAFSFLGQFVSARIWLQRIGGALIILFGFFIIGLFKVSFFAKEKRISIPLFFRKPTKGNSFFIGSIFALGWSPCVGPILGSVLLLAATPGSVVEGAFLLALFSAGLALPFLITALVVGRAYSAFGRIGKALNVINFIAGLFLIVLGILLISGQFSAVLARFQSFFFQFEIFQNFVDKFL